MVKSKRHAPRGRIKARPDDPSSDVPIKRRRPKVLCTGHSSQTGKPCQLAPIRGGSVCHKHGGSAPQVREAADARLMAMEMPALNRLYELMMQGEYPSVAIAAVKDALDRIRGRPTERVDLTVSSDDALTQAIASGRTRLLKAGRVPKLLKE